MRQLAFPYQYQQVTCPSPVSCELPLASSARSTFEKLRGSTQIQWGRRRRSWFRHCATSRKVADSIPDKVIEIFLFISSFRPLYRPGVDSASNRNEYQEYFLWGKGGRCVRLTTLPLSCADCLEIWETQYQGTVRTCPCL